MPQRPLVVDTSSLINLLATRREIEIAACLDWQLHISGHTERETLFLSTAPAPDGTRSRVSADLGPLRVSGRLTVHELADDWLEAFVKCAEHLPDEDASAVALAVHLGLPFATDDPKEMRIGQAVFGRMTVVTTLEWLHNAASSLRWDDSTLLCVASDLRWRGNFLPPRKHKHRQWYLDLLTRAGVRI